MIGVSVIAHRTLSRAEKEFKESKWVRTTQAVVIKKEAFRCEQRVCLYPGSHGDDLEMKQGEVQRRVYYQIENFDQVTEPRRGLAIAAEKDRVRSSYADEWSDRVEPGSKLQVRYQCFSDGRIEIVSVEPKT